MSANRSATMSRTNSFSSVHSSERSPLLLASNPALFKNLESDDRIPALSPSYLSPQPSQRSRKTSTTVRPPAYLLQHDDDGDETVSSAVDKPTLASARPAARDLDEEEADGYDEQDSINALPFPSQSDPSKPLRPKNYRINKNVGKARKFIARNEGVLLLAFAQLFFSTMNFFFKLINLLPPEESEKVTALEIIFIRMSITWIGCTGFMLITGVEHPFLGPPDVRKLLAFRGFIGFFGLFGLYYSLQYLSLADATVITFLGPLATGLLGFLVLGETFTVREAVGGIVSLSGVVLIARPAFLFGRKAADADLDGPMSLTSTSNSTAAVIVRGLAEMMSSTGSTLPSTLSALNASASSSSSSGTVEIEGVSERQRLLAVGIALLGVCAGAGAYITIRAIGRRASATHSVAYFSLYSTIVSALLMFFTGTSFVLPKNPKWCILLICVGVFGLAAQILLALALQREKAGRAVSATYLQIVVASIYQLVFLHIPIQPLSLVGITIILVSAGWVTIGKT